MQQSTIPGKSRVIRSGEINKNRENNQQEFSRQEWARYRCTEQVNRTMMISKCEWTIAR